MPTVTFKVLFVFVLLEQAQRAKRLIGGWSDAGSSERWILSVGRVAAGWKDRARRRA